MEETSLDRYFAVTATAQGKGAIGSEVSQVGVESFKNLGLYGHTESALVYYAAVRLKVIANVWTLAELQSVSYQDRSVNWLTLYTHSCCWNDLDFAKHEFWATSHEIASYAVSDAQVTGLTLNVQYVAPDAKQVEFAGQNVTATIPKTTFTFDRYVVENASYGDIAAYQDQYANLRDDSSGLSVLNVGRPEDAGVLGDATGVYNEEVSKLNLGVTAGKVQEGLIPDATKTGKIVKPSTGSTRFVKDGPAASLTVPVAITPRVTEARQAITVRSTAMWVDTVTDNAWFCGNAQIEGTNPTSDAQSFTRTVSAHVDNYYVQTSLFVDGYVFSTVELSAPVSETYLAKPEIVKGDYVWDLTLGGATSVDLGFTSAQDVVGDWFTDVLASWTAWLPQIIGLVVLVVVLVVLVKAFPSITSYITRKIQSKTGEG